MPTEPQGHGSSLVESPQVIKDTEEETEGDIGDDERSKEQLEGITLRITIRKNNKEEL